MARRRIQLGQESEAAGGWSYRVALLDAGGAVVSTHTVGLSWVDHDALSGGGLPPSEVLEAVLGTLLDAGRDEWPRRFDVSTARRWLPDLAETLPSRLRDCG